MKRFVLSLGVLVGSLLSFGGITTSSQAATNAGISQITENSPLYLDQAPSQGTQGGAIENYHYSHSSHESHYSHSSHRSHYSGY